MNTALRSRLKHAKKNTKKAHSLARKTKKFRRKNYWMKPKSLKK